MPIRDEDGEMSIVYEGGSETWEPELFVSDWKQEFVFMPKKTISGTTTRPLSTVYTRQREDFVQGQRQLLTEWLTQGEYVMLRLKAE